MNFPRLAIAAALIMMLSACGGGGGSDSTAFNPVVSMNANIGSESITNYTAEYTK